MAAVSLASLILTEAKAVIYSTALSIASAIGLPVTSWQAGDPTRTTLNALADALEIRDQHAEAFIRAGFLDYATGDWLKIVAEQMFGVTVPDAVAATTDVVLTNSGGGVYTVEAGDLTFKNTSTGKTYRNTTGGVLGAKVGAVNGTLTVTVIADETGSDSSAGAGEIDDLVTPLGPTTCSNTVAAVGVDEQSEATTRTQCRARRGRATPNGPKDAYTDVAMDPELTGTSAVTDARAFRTSAQGDVTVYLRGPSGAVSSDDRTLVETAILEQATPLCVTPTVLSCSAVTVPVTYELWIYKRGNLDAADAEDAAETALESLFAACPIGGDIVSPATTGKLYASAIDAALLSISRDAFRVSRTLPAGDTSLTNAQVPALGTVTAVIHIEKDPT